MEPRYKIEHSSSGSRKYVSYDGGKTWKIVSFISSSEMARRELFAYEQNKIQRELK